MAASLPTLAVVVAFTPLPLVIRLERGYASRMSRILEISKRSNTTEAMEPGDSE